MRQREVRLLIIKPKPLDKCINVSRLCQYMVICIYQVALSYLMRFLDAVGFFFFCAGNAYDRKSSFEL